MLSILIPLHNYDINALTKSLILQAEKTGIDYEIIIVDDFSDMSYDAVNKLVISNKKVKFYKNSNNIGRSQTRNKLADMAVYNNLLFIDCDAEICSENYLKNYINHFKNYKVICGGTDYQHNAPDMNYLLRWKYGVNREKISSIKRNIFPSGSFSGFNFMIKKDVFQNIGFDESIYKYGHEDTLLGIELAKNNIEIKHIDNTLIHKGLEENSVFLEKSIIAVDNLFYLYKNHPLSNELAKNIKILGWYKIINRCGLSVLLKPLYGIFGKLIKKNLLGNNPNLFLFDFYRLLNICSL